MNCSGEEAEIEMSLEIEGEKTIERERKRGVGRACLPCNAQFRFRFGEAMLGRGYAVVLKSHLRVEA